MSIINQALKKAQREQRLHSVHTLVLPTQPSPVQPRRGWWFVLTVASGIALCGGALWYVWLTSSPTPPATTRLATVPRETRSDSLPHPRTPESPRPAAVIAPTAIGPASAAAPPGPTVPAPRPHNPPLPLPQSMTTAQLPLPQSPQDNEVRTRAPGAPATPQPTLALTYFNRAIEAQTAGELDNAVTLLRQAIALDPTLKYAYNSLGNLYYQQQQYREAVAMYQQALAVDSAYSQARINLGSAYMQLDQPEQAIAEFHQVLQADGDASLAYYNLACVYARTGDSVQAIHYLQRAMEIEPQARVWAQTDADFHRIRSEPEFQRLVGPS